MGKFRATGQHEVTPVISTGIYASADQIGGITEITNFVGGENGGQAYLSAIAISDESDQKAEIDLLFFDQNPNTTTAITSVDNGVFTIVDAGMSDMLIAKYTVLASDYIGLVNSAFAYVENTNLPLHATRTTSSIWVAAMVRGTPTYATTNALTFRFSVDQSG